MRGGVADVASKKTETRTQTKLAIRRYQPGVKRSTVKQSSRGAQAHTVTTELYRHPDDCEGK